jgi:hypothetical protein
MEFIDNKESFASRDIRKKPKEHAHGAGATDAFHQRAHMPPALQIYIYHTALYAPKSMFIHGTQC